MTEEFPAQQLTGVYEFINDLFRKSGAQGVVVGLSGGIDSALVSRLCVDALGADKVLNVFMPSATTPAADEEWTRGYSALLGADHLVVPIQDMVDAFETALSIKDRVELGNVMARCRMIVLYHMAKEGNRLVMGTGNRSELLMGYFTKHGDGACDALPIGHLYKSQVRELARHLGLPDETMERAPSAGLWKGQNDEEEMGISYEQLDLILQGMGDETSPEEIAGRLAVPLERVMSIEARVVNNRHKRHSPPIPDL